MKKLPIFVYGTLRNGFGNYERLLKGNTIAEHAAITTGSMFSVYGGGFPALLTEPKSNEPIKGELMFIKDELYDEVIRSLDWLEGYHEEYEHESMYLRKAVKICDESKGEMIESWVYYWNRNGSGLGEHVESGCWKEYKNKKWTSAEIANMNDRGR